MKMSQTALHGSVRGSSRRNGIDPKAPTANTRLSIGTLTALLTTTRAHCIRVVTLATNQEYTSVSRSSLTTIATIDAAVIRHSGASTALNSGPSGYEASVGA